MRKMMLVAATVLMVACGNSSKKTDETPTRGTATVLVDETFLPMIEGQVQVFESQYKYAHFNIEACPEQEISMLMRSSDSLRIAVLSRELTPAEAAWFEGKSLTPRITEIAYDAIALVVNRESRDSLITTDQLRAMLRGTAGADSRMLVFDNSASGTVRYMKELAGLDSLSGVYSAKSNRGVIEYVASHQGTIGFVGVDWLYEADSTQRQYVDKIKVLSVSDGASGYWKPTQQDIAEGNYPFTRKLYLINCQGTAGLGMGLASFVAGDLGQRIVLKSGLVPVKYPEREIVIRKEL